MWKEGLNRAKSGKTRLGDDNRNLIEEFFSNQEHVKSHEIVDTKEWIVNVDGSVHIYQNNLEKLFFKIGKLTGNLYFHVKRFSPSVVPTEMDGEIVFVPDEEELAKARAQKGNNEEDNNLKMGLLTDKSREQVVKLLETALTESVANGYDIDIQEILTRLSEEWKNKDKYQLRVVIKDIEYGNANYKRKSNKLECEFYIAPSEEPLNLSAIEKATYLLFILHEKGLELNMKKKSNDLLKKIYNQLEGAVQDMENGIMSNEFRMTDTTLNSYRSHIRKEIQKRISNSKIVDEFAIEGKKEEPFTVQRATDEMRAEIREKFGLD